MSIYKREDSPIWYLNISRPGFPRIRESTGTADRQEALRIHDEKKAALWKLKAPVEGRTWGAAVLLWIKKEERSSSELYSLRKFAKHYPDRPIEEVEAEGVDKALSFCKTAGTYTRYRTTIRAVLGVAKDEGWINAVPKLRTRTDKKRKTRKWLTPEQWTKLYLELPPHQRPAADFGVQTGLRRENVLGLTWDRVDLDRRLVWVEAEDMKGGEALPVPLNDRAHLVLSTLWSSPDRHKTWVFTFRGKRITTPKKAFQLACIRAGVGEYYTDADGVVRYRGFTWHGLRHTWATWHSQNGTPMDVLQKLGAWKDERMVRNYAHHNPGYLAQFANNNLKR